MWSTDPPSYNGGMDTTTTSPAPHFAVAGEFLEALAAHDFERLAVALEPDASLTALVPKGLREREGAAEICDQFETWFGDVEEFEVADAFVGQVGSLLQLRWRLRLQGARLGEEPMVVEQQAYAATGPNGRIQRLRLLCSGFCREHPDA
jgi:ketosteroid isomerase-like protein